MLVMLDTWEEFGAVCSFSMSCAALNITTYAKLLQSPRILNKSNKILKSYEDDPEIIHLDKHLVTSSILTSDKHQISILF